MLSPIKALAACCLLGLTLAASPVLAQGKSKQYVVTSDRALIVTREVLVKQGFEVVRVDNEGPSRVVYYRSGNHGRGKGKGRLEKLIIRREEDHVVFIGAPQPILGGIDIRLHL